MHQPDIQISLQGYKLTFSFYLLSILLSHIFLNYPNSQLTISLRYLNVTCHFYQLYILLPVKFYPSFKNKFKKNINSSQFFFQGAPVIHALLLHALHILSYSDGYQSSILECKLSPPLKGGCVTVRFLILTAVSTVTFTQNVS